MLICLLGERTGVGVGQLEMTGMSAWLIVIEPVYHTLFGVRRPGVHTVMPSCFQCVYVADGSHTS